MNTPHVVEPTIPKRDSLPSILPPAWRSVLVSTYSLAINTVFPHSSDTATETKDITNTINIATKIANPCFLSLTVLPKVKQSAAEINNIDNNSIKLLNQFGFSNGCAKLTP